jgi:multiple sugar transport system permease protein
MADGATYVILFLATGLAILPLVWMVVNSLTLLPTTISSLEKPVQNFVIAGMSIHFDSYVGVFQTTKFVLYMRNSVFVAGTTTILSIVVGVLGGYSLSRFRFRGREAFGLTLLALYMFPPVLLLIPVFIILRTEGLFDSPFGLIVAYTTFSLPFCIWMLKGYFDTIPPDLEEQAMVDGCTRVGSMVRVLLPLSGAGIASTAIFSFILAWNEFMYANALIHTDEWKTVTVGMPSFAGQYMTELGIMLAASTLVVIPVLFLFLFLQKYIVRGLTAGAVKG